MTKARGPHVRQKAFNKTIFVRILATKASSLVAGFYFSCWLAAGSHGYLLDLILSAVSSELTQPFHIHNLSDNAGIYHQTSRS